MQNEFIEQFSDAGKIAFSAIQELSTIQGKALQKLVDLQLNFATAGFGSGIEHAEALVKSTNHKMFFSSISGFNEDCSNKMLDITRQTSAVLSESNDEVIAWFEKGLEASNNTGKTSSKRVTKKAAE